MLLKIKRVLAATFAISLLSFNLIPATVGAAAIKQSACQGSKLSLGSSDVDTDACKYEGEENPGGKVDSLISDIVNIFSVIVGIVAVIMIIYGGFRYITSGGDSSKVADAKNTILYAIIGLVIVVFAQFIVQFVLSKIAGTS